MLQRLVITPDQLYGRQISLTVEQKHYLYRVLRLRDGDRFIAMDGQGKTWLAQLVKSEAVEFQAETLEEIIHRTELPIAVTLVAALPKGNGFDEVVRQATELGVNWIVPVISDRTLLNPSPKKWERWQRIAHEAAEQSERECVPAILEPTTFALHLQQVAHWQQSEAAQPTQKYLCVTRKNSPHLLDVLLPSTSNPGFFIPGQSISMASITIAIGPEGGWTDTEIDQAIAVGYQPVSLGARILRSVTAPLVTLSLISAVFEREIRAEAGAVKS
jgi:16S rRNA (uracil1498-N3)-methyltransferase